MIFNLGKNRSESDRSIQTETLQRWRDASGTRNEAASASEITDEAIKPRAEADNLSYRTIDLRSEAAVSSSESWSLGKDEELAFDSWQVSDTKEQVREPSQAALELRSPQKAPVAVFVEDSAGPSTQAAPAPVAFSSPAFPAATATSPVTTSTPVSRNETSKEAQPNRTPSGDPNLPAEEDLRRRFGAHLHSALGSGTVIEGKLTFDSPVRIDGTLNGEVTSTSTLIVGENALIRAALKVGSLIVLGQIDGDVQATDLVEIKKGGHLNGDVLSKRIVIEDGGFLEGLCRYQQS